MAAQLNMLSKYKNKFVWLLAFILCWTTIAAIATSESPKTGIAFTPLNYQQWLEKLDSYKPKIVVVDMWATWCSTCLEEFPKIVALHKQYKGQDIQFVSMNLDDHNDQPALKNAEKFLQKMNSEFDNFWMDENLMIAFEQLGLIGIPAVIIYDRNGEERYRLTGDDPNNQYTGKDIDAAIQELLAH